MMGRAIAAEGEGAGSGKPFSSFRRPSFLCPRRPSIPATILAHNQRKELRPFSFWSADVIGVVAGTSRAGVLNELAGRVPSVPEGSPLTPGAKAAPSPFLLLNTQHPQRTALVRSTPQPTRRIIT